METHDIVVNENFQSDLINDNILLLKKLKVLFQYPSTSLTQSAIELALVLSQFTELDEFQLTVNSRCIILNEGYQSIAEVLKQQQLKRLKLVIGKRCLFDESFINFLKISLSQQEDLQDLSIHIQESNFGQEDCFKCIGKILSNRINLLKLDLRIQSTQCFGNQQLSSFCLSCLQKQTNLIELQLFCDFNEIDKNSSVSLGKSLQNLQNLKSLNIIGTRFVYEKCEFFFMSLRYLKNLTFLSIIFNDSDNRTEELPNQTIQQIVQNISYLTKLKQIQLNGFINERTFFKYYKQKGLIFNKQIEDERENDLNLYDQINSEYSELLILNKYNLCKLNKNEQDKENKTDLIQNKKNNNNSNKPNNQNIIINNIYMECDLIFSQYKQMQHFNFLQSCKYIQKLILDFNYYLLDNEQFQNMISSFKFLVELSIGQKKSQLKKTLFYEDYVRLNSSKINYLGKSLLSIYNLEKLNLNIMRQQDYVKLELAEGIRNQKYLKDLRLNLQEFEYADWIDFNQELTFSKLKRLTYLQFNVQGRGFGISCAFDLSKGLKYLSNLNSLYISLGRDCQICKYSAKEIANSISNMLDLQTLSIKILGDNKIGTQGAEWILGFKTYLKNLKQLNNYSIQIDQGVNVESSILKNFYKYQDLQFKNININLNFKHESSEQGLPDLFQTFYEFIKFENNNEIQIEFQDDIKILIQGYQRQTNSNYLFQFKIANKYSFQNQFDIIHLFVNDKSKLKVLKLLVQRFTDTQKLDLQRKIAKRQKRLVKFEFQSIKRYYYPYHFDNVYS